MTESSRDPEHVPFATVAVCTRNRAELLRECLASLIAQDYPTDRFEVIVVDDGSTDDTREVFERVTASAPVAFRYLAQPHSGLSNSRNRAITEGRGELICFLDDDAVASTSWLASIVDAAVRHPDVDCFAGRLLLRLEAEPPRNCGDESFAATVDEGEEEVAGARAKGANMAMRRSTFERIGMFNPSLVWRGDEDNWQRRLADDEGRSLYVPGGLAWHRRSPADLKPWSVLKTRFGWGVGQVQFKRETSVRFNLRAELDALRSDLRHAWERRCFGGLMQAAMRIGAIWAFLRGEARKPRTETPRVVEQHFRKV